jgi:alpha-beta hydrolase superfamily lysophospholipase
MVRARLIWLGGGLAAAIAVAAVLLVEQAPPREIEAAALLAEIATRDVHAFPPRAVSWSEAGHAYRGDLYGMAPTARAAILLVPGAAETGKDDPRLVNIARALAQHRFLVLVPDLEGPRSLRVSSGDIQGVADSAVYLASLEPPGTPFGIAAISYGVGPALIATLDKRLVDRITFFVGLGGYYSTTDTLTFFTTGYWRADPDAPWQLGTPNAYGKWVFVLANAGRLDDFVDRRRLERIARAKLANLDADIGPLESSLGPEGRAVMALLDNRSLARVPDLIATLPPAIGQEIRALDLARRDFSRLNAEAILIHGKDDAIVPYGESVALAQALAGSIGAGRVHLYLLDYLRHASLAPEALPDAVRLWRAATELLVLRDGGR